MKSMKRIQLEGMKAEEEIWDGRGDGCVVGRALFDDKWDGYKALFRGFVIVEVCSSVSGSCDARSGGTCLIYGQRAIWHFTTSSDDT